MNKDPTFLLHCLAMSNSCDNRDRCNQFMMWKAMSRHANHF